jgi:L-amino acid N-acyltransferase YncA
MPLQQVLYRVSKRVIDALPPWVMRVRPFHVLEIDLSETLPTEEPHNNLSIVETRWIATSQELASLASIADPTNLEKWNASTHRVAVASRDSEPIGLVWISTPSFEEPQLGLVVELAPNDAWLHSAYVVPAHRRQGVYRELLEFVFPSLREEGFRRILLGVTSGNAASRRAHECVGATGIGRIIAARTLNVSVTYSAGQVRCNSGRRTGLGRRVQIRLDPSEACAGVESKVMRFG